ALAGEAADVLYHLLVMLEACDLSLDDALAALAAREGVSGVDEKAARDMPVVIERALCPEHLARCFALRVEVFIAEEGVSAADEQDGEDGACRHWIAHRGTETLGTLRVKPTGPQGGQGAKIQRVAISRRARGKGLGARLMRSVLSELGVEDQPIWLESQTSAIPFYERLSFFAEGPEFMDAGIPHRRMVHHGR
ncbi:MAG: GNAT family N-acetyltransferase, partial [Pseudomonadota bacterium]